MEDIRVIFFDLFFTLVIPQYNDSENENDILGITQAEWEKYAEDSELYIKRASGKVKNPEKIIEEILEKMKITVGRSEIKEILELRAGRIKKSLMNIDFTILEVLNAIKEKKIKLCLISNADIIDTMYWKDSPLYPIFDTAIFSHEVGYLKPQPEIYEIALKNVNVKPEQCIFIGDGGSDELKGAKESGIKTILTSYLLKSNEKPQNGVMKFADYYITDFNEIKNIIS